MGENSVWTKTQLAVFYVIILLSIDEINPVKVVLHVFPFIQPWHIASCSGILMLYIFISDVKALLYFGAKVFFHSILSIFFRSVEVVGRKNIPTQGPAIFAINHANQFMDAVMIVCSSQRPISFLMAEKSWKRRLIGDLAWALGVVPVKRAQDTARTGTGKIYLTLKDRETHEIYAQGMETKFESEFKIGDKLRPPNTPFGLKVTEIRSDTEMVLNGEGMPSDFPEELFESKEFVSFDILKHTPLATVFASVLDRLAAGGALGIFPEGGSHDRTNLLPLKVGVSLIAYSALEQHGQVIPIIPVGLHYYRAHRWRGRVVVEYGAPVFPDASRLHEFTSGDRQVCNDLLSEVETAMRSVLVAAPNYDDLQNMLMARRLFQRSTVVPREKVLDLSRRFAFGGQRMLLIADEEKRAKGIALRDRLDAYRRELRDLGVKDHQVPALNEERLEDDTVQDGDGLLRVLQLLYNIAHKTILIAISAIPVLLLNLPVGVMAGIYSESRRKTALANSKVKVKGFDVMLTEKVVFCVAMVPTLWFTYFLILKFCTNLDGPCLGLIMFSMPICAYAGIVVVESGIISWHDLRPNMLRLFPSSRKRLAMLPATRKALKDDLRAFLRLIGPELGDIYSNKTVDWAKIQEENEQLSREDNGKKDQ